MSADLYLTPRCLGWVRTLEEARGFANRGGMLLPDAPAVREALVGCSCRRHEAFEGCIVRYSDDGLQSLYAAEVV